MKKRILIIAMIFTALLGIFGCGRPESNTVTSLESMTLTLRGMRGSYVYEIVNEADKAELRRLREVYSGEETLLEVEASAVCDIQVIIDLMNTCTVMNWDGFHGKHPKNVQDGIMFTFIASVNGDQTVSADGSANFPNGYHEFVSALNKMLAEAQATEQ